VLLRNVGDDDLATAVGRPIGLEDHPKQRLSVREREVYELMVQGLSNLQIANILFISPATVKVHVQHIFDKLGVRSRSALMVQAALERSAHATSAIESTTSESDGPS
jgi:DNA-binding CsgD family transcriptional regulator